jgi:hypothetical protein
MTKHKAFWAKIAQNALCSLLSGTSRIQVLAALWFTSFLKSKTKPIN